MPTDTPSTERLQHAVAEWLPPEPRRIRAVRHVQMPLSRVDTALRKSPEHVIRLAYPDAGQSDEPVVHLRPYPRLQWLSVPVVIESVSSPTHEGPGVVSIRWRASWLTGAFPQMEAELVLHSAGPEACELQLDGRYHPPLGLLGLVVDRLLGRRVADATACTFLDRLAVALEAVEE
jgi:hypothetical protein